MPVACRLPRPLLPVLLLLFLHSATCFAGTGDEAGNIVAMRGPVTIVRDGGTLTPRTRDPVFEKDVIRTGATGRVQIMFRDNTLISLGVNTETAIDTYRFQPEEQKAAMRTTVKEGVLRVMGGAITRMAPENFTTETPTATIGIRGSMYLVKSSAVRTDAVFLGGKGIFVENGRGRVEIDTPGFGTRVELGGIPAPARRMSGDEMKHLEEATAGKAGRQNDGDGQGRETPANEEDDNKPAATNGDQESGSGAVGSPATPSPAPAGYDDPAGGTAALPPPAAPGSSYRTGQGPATDGGAIAATITAISQTASQEILTDTTIDRTTGGGTGPSTGTGTTPTPTPLALQGYSLGGLTGPAGGRLYGLTATGANASGTNTGGTVAAKAGYANGAIFALDFAIAPPDSAGTGFTAKVDTGLATVRNLLALDRSFTTTKLISSSLGDFAYLMVDREPFTASGGSFSYSELSSLGALPGSLPTGDGITRYAGDLLSVSKNSVGSPLAAELQQVDVAVNWSNGKVLGFVSHPGPPSPTSLISAYFVGEVAGHTVGNIRVFGSGNDPDPSSTTSIAAIGGAGTDAGFYGFLGQGIAGGAVIDFRGIGTDMGIPQSSAEVVLAALRTDLPVGLAPPVATAAAIFQGFAVGIAEDITNIDSNRRLYMSSPGDFGFTVDRSQGTLAGSLTVADTLAPSVSLNGLAVGNPGTSAYIADRALFAELSGSAAGNSALNGTAAGPLKPAGNYLVSEDPARQPASHATWGYWEVAYQDPASLADYHLHVPYSTWVAGERTPAAEVQSLIDAGTVTATYSGKAHGTVTDTSRSMGQVTQLPEGNLALTVDFGKTTMADAVTGSIAFPADTATGFPGRVLPIGSAASMLNSGGFQAMVNDPGVISSQVNGAFYGPGAKSVGGNFRADYATEHYLGIFLGDRP
ncbi:MAG: FecR domain-containing protein [Thermodesulfobacteriota bacterium]